MIETSLLRRILRSLDTQSAHRVEEGGSLYAESRGCASWTAQLPIGALAGSENLLTHLDFEGGISKTSSAAMSISNISYFNSRRPASILERSRMSLIKASR